MQKLDKLHIVIPMAGLGSRFSSQGYALPKPFIDVAGRMMIQRVLSGLKIPEAAVHLVIRREFLESQAGLLARLKEEQPLDWIVLDRPTQGACCTALAAHQAVDPDGPVLFVDSDNVFFDTIIRDFVIDAISRGLDGSLLTVYSQNPAFSYASTDADGKVTKTQEKSVISSHALCGAYYFGRSRDFIHSAIQMMIYGDLQKGEYYLSNAYNYLVKDGKNVGIYEIQSSSYACLGTPEQLTEYLNATA